MFKGLGFVFLLGVFFIVLGLGVFVVSVVMIGFHESVLADESASQQEIWDSEGALIWWKDFCLGVASPLALILIIIGLMVEICDWKFLSKRDWKLSDFIKIEIIEEDEEKETLE